MPALLLHVGLAVALAPAGAELEWSAPQGCPSRAAVEAAAAALLGRPLAGGGAEGRVRARGVITREPRGFRLDLELAGDAGVDRRSLRDHRCQVLADAAAEILATAIDPSLAAVPPALPPEPDGTWPEEHVATDMTESNPAPLPAPAPASAPPRASAPAPAPAPADPLEPAAPPADPLEPAAPPPAPAPDRTRASLRLAAVFDQGSLPGPTGGLALAFGAMRRAWRVELGLGGYIPRDVRTEPGRPYGARLSLWTASIRACGVGRPGRRLELAGCGALEAGALLGAAFGVSDGRIRAQPWLAVVVGPELAWPVGRRVALTLGVDAVVPLVRPLFVLGDAGALFRVHPAAFRAALGVQLRFR